MQIRELPVTYDELKTLVLEVLRAHPRTQYGDILVRTAGMAVARKVVPSPLEGVVSGATYDLHENDKSRVLEIIWDLVIQRILTMGGEGVNGGWPWFNLTAYGAKVVADPSVRIPHDPTGYLQKLQSEVPTVDPVILAYLEESLHTYNINAILSATIALGCASEKAMLLVIDAFGLAIRDASKRATFQRKTDGAFIKKRFDVFDRLFQQTKSNLPKDLVDGIDITFASIFEMIRVNRNDAGHPTGKRPSREQMYASLQLFPIYLKKAYDLLEYLKTNPILV